MSSIRAGGVLNQLEGIRAGNDVTLTRCIATSNGREGIEVGEQAVVQACVATDNGQDGIDADTASMVGDCVARQNGLSGFFIGDMSTVRDCTAADNQDGFVLTGGTVRSCNAEGNSETGFELLGAAVLEHNLATRNGTRGFQVLGAGTRLDGNHAHLNNPGTGFEAAGSGADGLFAIRNSADQNGLDFQLIGGAFVGSPADVEAQATPWSNLD